MRSRTQPSRATDARFATRLCRAGVLIGLSFAAVSLHACKVRIPSEGVAAEGDFPCESSDVCPAPDNSCLIATCLDGQCVFVPAPNGVLPEEEQIAGDCKERYCDGDGEAISYAAQHDLPKRDFNQCTTSICDLDTPKQEPKVAGTHCRLPDGGEGLCNGKDSCGVCLPKARRCDDHNAVTLCDGNGQWGPADACPADKPVCSQGACRGVVEIASGAEHLCARFDEGAVRCWGNAEGGRLGDGGVAGGAIAPWVGGFASMTVGRRHQCGVQKDGTVWCWGHGEMGQLGNGAYTSSSAPVSTGLSATAVAVGDEHSCALVAGGHVHCWGRNDMGQLGGGKAPTAILPLDPIGSPRLPEPTPRLIAGLGDARQLALGQDHTCVTRTTGETRCWGVISIALDPTSDDDDATTGPPPDVLKATKATPTPVVGLSDAVEIGCGSHHCCARLSGGTVSCWGAADKGALGTSDSSHAFQAVAVSNVSSARHIAVGRNFACALLADATVTCWGANDRGQLGTGYDKPRNTAHSIAALAGVRGLTVGDEHACVLLQSGSVMCWGDNRAGQLGREGLPLANQPTPLAWP